jgi:lipoprotein-anchoring transpeptidase ErfK/SrfK
MGELDSAMKQGTLLAAALAATFFSLVNPGNAATLVARVDVGSQTMTVSEDGRIIHSWKVSTARRGYVTPRGTYRPQRLYRMWRSRKYDNAPMPYSVFYNGGYAVHGTGHVKSLGRPASHGCVRLATSNAKRFYDLVQQHGRNNVRIILAN